MLKGGTMRAARLLLLCTALLPLQAAPSLRANLECKSFEKLYSSGKNLCNKMFGNAFRYEEDPNMPAYTMWWVSGTENPNYEVTKQIAARSDINHTMFGFDPATGRPKHCLDYFHKEKPGPEAGMTECHIFSKDSCCHAKTVKDPETIEKAYGEEYHWNRCGELSPACKRFFVYEACLYECDPSVALWSKYLLHPDAANHSRAYDKDNEDHNRWEMQGMPIQAGFCDNWYDACKDDMFCATDSGNFFSCARKLAMAQEEAEAELSAGWIAIIVVLCVVAGSAAVYGTYLILREKQGKRAYYTSSAVRASDRGPNESQLSGVVPS